jgi:hypothetical protein
MKVTLYYTCSLCYTRSTVGAVEAVWGGLLVGSYDADMLVTLYYTCSLEYTLSLCCTYSLYYTRTPLLNTQFLYYTDAL